MFNEIYNKIQDKVGQELNSYVKQLNGMSLESAINHYSNIRKFLWLTPSVIAFLCLTQIFFPISTLKLQFVTLILWLILVASLVCSAFSNWFLLNLSTRKTDLTEDELVDYLWSNLHSTINQISFILGTSALVPISFTLIPFLQFLRLHPGSGVTPQLIDMVNGNPFILRLLLEVSAIYLGFYIRNSAFETKLSMYEQQIEQWMRSYQFHYDPLKEMLDTKKNKDLSNKANNILTSIPEKDVEVVPSMSNEVRPKMKLTPPKLDPEPVINLGMSLETGANVILSAENRRRNMMALGPIGAGKSSIVFKNQIAQDINHYITFLRDYPTVSKLSNWEKPFGKQVNYLNGFSVVETTNDLCRDVYEMAISKGIPKEKIRWIDPSNKKSPSLSLLSGPAPMVANNLVNIIDGLLSAGGKGNAFFNNESKNHFTNHIYLLKYVSVIEKKPASFSELMDMYSDIYVVVEKRRKLSAYVQVLKNHLDKMQDKRDKGELSEDEIYDLEDFEDKYTVALHTLEWFNTNLITATDNKGNILLQPSGEHEGEPVYWDAKAKYVSGLVSILKKWDISIPVRRVLFRDAGDFSLDDFIKNGGILLCNTAKDELGSELAELLGQTYVLSLEGASYRRKPNIDPMFPVYMDEFPDYLYAGFTKWAAQGRKYNVPLIIAAQAPSQLAQKYGNTYLSTLTSTMLTRIAFGDMGASDSMTLEKLFGTHEEPVESVSDQAINISAGQDKNRTMISTRMETVPNISANELMKLEKFTIAVRYPGEKHSELFTRIRVSRITQESINNDPNNFDINYPDDENAFKYSQAHQVHTNKDFDDIDLEIHKQALAGTLKVLVDPHDLTAPPVVTINGKPLGEDNTNKNSKNNVQDEDGLFTINQGMLDDLVEDNNTQENNVIHEASESETDNPFDIFEDDQEVKNEPKTSDEVINAAVEGHAHGGNNRFNNGLKEDSDSKKLKNSHPSQLLKKVLTIFSMIRINKLLILKKQFLLII
ncbi:hypothetical protein FP435_00005 (plasmid) [Lactobacillus sp. PV037]|uniref:type IV secretory system conjugative DNA transfer family protein n=1 Tax=Lactobacillus sp. PV037 TaxID=2594496 RepID=UPI00223F99EC|nr:TraM recognition domain-containing protein [Lactobacillus sp. PV037]QNQ83007.1 hypothetical protein FP435_00005 [Lactobacillus sp. PV037]